MCVCVCVLPLVRLSQVHPRSRKDSTLTSVCAHYVRACACVRAYSAYVCSDRPLFPVHLIQSVHPRQRKTNPVHWCACVRACACVCRCACVRACACVCKCPVQYACVCRCVQSVFELRTGPSVRSNCTKPIATVPYRRVCVYCLCVSSNLFMCVCVCMWPLRVLPTSFTNRVRGV
jgi:hypothetical protein